MLNSLNERLYDIKEALNEKERLQEVSRSISENRKLQKEKLVKLEANLQRKEIIIKGLEKFGLSSIFYTISGKKNEILDMERENYSIIKKEYQQCKDSLLTIEKELKQVNNQINQLSNIDEQYEQVMAEKEKYILAEGGMEANQIIEMDEDIYFIQVDAARLKRAINAGKAVLNEVYKLNDYLKSAKNWGIWDMLGGGLLTTAVKHSKLNEAKHISGSLKQQMKIFTRELNHVCSDLKTGVTIDIGSFLTFADYFFDGLIADWAVQSKINNSLDRASSLENKVKHTVYNLQAKLNQNEERLFKLEDEKRRFVERYH